MAEALCFASAIQLGHGLATTTLVRILGRFAEMNFSGCDELSRANDHLRGADIDSSGSDQDVGFVKQVTFE